MPQALHPTIEARRDQMFPVLEPIEIERLTRFGERKSYAPGARIFTTGEVAPGAFIILAGRAEASQHRLDRSEPIVTHGSGSFMGELAQLSGRPSLVDAVVRRADRGAGYPAAAVARSASGKRQSSASGSCAP
jgi:thioredoxin reductase (NADPH)